MESDRQRLFLSPVKGNLPRKKTPHAEFFRKGNFSVFYPHRGPDLRLRPGRKKWPAIELKKKKIIGSFDKSKKPFDRPVKKIENRSRALPKFLPLSQRPELEKTKLHKIILKYSLVKVLQKIVNNVQSVYRSQGVEIYDQHIEVLISQMGSKIRIKEDFDSKFFWNEIVPLSLIKDNTEIKYEPVISGITRISLQTDSFISAASFQSSSKILSQESLKKSKDFLFGLKESIIVNELIPSGTGIFITS